MPILRAFIMLLLAFACASTGAKAESGHLYTSGELSSAFVSCIEQTGNKFLWIGTGNGLNRFDGYHFTQYMHRDDDSTSLPHKIVTTLFTDSQDRLWVGTGKGLARYDEASNSFHQYKLRNGKEEEPRVTQMAQDGKGKLLVGTSGFGLYELDTSTGTTRHTDKFAKGGSNDFYTIIHIDKKQRFWKGDNDGRICCFTDDGKLLLDFQPGYGLPVDIKETGKGDILLVCKNGVATLSPELKIKDKRPSVYGISSALIDVDGKLMLGTSHGVMAASANSFVPMEIENNEIDFPSTNVNVLFADHQHNLWLSCAGRGLFFLPYKHRGFTSWSLSEQGYKTGSTISSVARASDGGLWVVLRGAKLYHFTMQGRIDREVQAPEGLTFIHRDCKGRLWAGAGTTLYRVSEPSGNMSAVKTFNCDFLQTMTSLPPTPSKGGGDRLVISLFGHGIAEYNPETGETKLFSMLQEDKGGGRLCNDWVFSLLRDSHGLMWAGTSYGVSCYDPVNDTFKAFGWDVLLKGYACLSLAETSNGDIVIGTEHGLYVFDRKKNKVSQLPNSSALSDKTIASIITLPNGDIWCSTSVGLWHYRHADRQLIGHISDNGLHEHEFTEGTGMRLDNGYLLFSSSNNLVVFSPKDVGKSGRKPMPPVLTALYIGGQPMSIDNLSFSYQDNTFTMEFSNFDFREASNIIFEYRLDNDRWSQLPRGENSLTFIHQHPGTYRLQVRVVENGLASKENTYSIHIRSPWYSSTVAYIIYIILLVSLAAYVKWRIDSRRRQRLAMQRLQETIDNLLNKDKVTEADKERQTKSVGEYGKQVDQREVTDIDRDLMERIMKSMNKNMDNSDYSVVMMAEDVGLSRSQLSRRMKELTGLSPSDFLRTIRLDQAARLLRERKTNITQVAYAVGFSSLNTFTKAFKQHFGKSPTEFAATTE